MMPWLRIQRQDLVHSIEEAGHIEVLETVDPAR
jgi:hypothetical protein